jgi:hypothetical protein
VWGVSTSFSGLTVENVPTSYPVVQLKHVYFPDTQTGYKFSYSAYGMIYNVSMRKQMTIDQNGNITDGTEKAYVSFNYPTGPSSLTDAPAFTQRTEYPAASSGGTAVYSYSTGGTPGTNKTFTITRPDSSTVTLTRSDVSGAVDFGLLTQTEIKNSGGTVSALSGHRLVDSPAASRSLIYKKSGSASDTPTARLQSTYIQRFFMWRRPPSLKTSTHNTTEETMTSRPKNVEIRFANSCSTNRDGSKPCRCKKATSCE